MSLNLGFRQSRGTVTFGDPTTSRQHRVRILPLPTTVSTGPYSLVVPPFRGPCRPTSVLIPGSPSHVTTTEVKDPADPDVVGSRVSRNALKSPRITETTPRSSCVYSRGKGPRQTFLLLQSQTQDGRTRNDSTRRIVLITKNHPFQTGK